MNEESEHKVVRDSGTSNAMKFYKFCAEKMKRKEEISHLHLDKVESASRFAVACATLISNPYYAPPHGSVPSMEDVIKIENAHEIRDQLR